MPLFASLPMYDWPQIKSSTNRYFDLIRQSLADHGFAPLTLPRHLTRDTDPHNDWLESELVLSQTCGLPFARELRGKVTLLGAPAYELDCPPGYYYSVLIARKGAEHSVKAMASGKVAINDLRSQSGHAAYFQHLQRHGVCQFTGKTVMSGSHFNSIKLVAEGKADYAAIDAVSFTLSKRYCKEANAVTVIGNTDAMPGLPYVTSLTLLEERAKINAAISAAVDGLSSEDKSNLHLTGYVAKNDEDYDIVLEQWNSIVEAGLALT